MAVATGAALKPKRYKGKQWTVGVRPGDPLPAGKFVKAWKLDPMHYGQGTLYIVYEPDEPVTSHKRKDN